MRSALPAVLLALLAACGGAAPGNDQALVVPGNLADAAAPANGAEALPPPASVNPALYLPAAGTYAARAMTIAVPTELEALRRRLTAAATANIQWFRAYAAEHPGELPYHPNLGLSEAEYRRYLALTHELGLREAERVTLTVTRRPDGGLTLAGTGQAAPLNGLIVYPDRVEARRGALRTRTAIDNREARSPTGPWRGLQWSNRGAPHAPAARLAFGRRAQGDRIVFYDYGPSDAETVILLYDAPSGSGGAR